MIGEYVLVSVNGEPLPFRIFEGDVTHQDIIRGSLSLTDAGEAEIVTESRIGRWDVRESQVDSVSGTYRFADGVVTVDVPNRPAAKFERDGNELTLQISDEHVFVWRRKIS